jgi:hypothetical protein
MSKGTVLAAAQCGIGAPPSTLHLTGPDAFQESILESYTSRIMILRGRGMRRRKFRGLALRPRPVQGVSLPEGAAGNSVQTEEQDLPLIIANMPATRQRATAPGVGNDRPLGTIYRRLVRGSLLCSG